MTPSEKYQGWTNYETWNVALWLGNDEALYRAATDAVAGCSNDRSAGQALHELVMDSVKLDPETKQGTFGDLKVTRLRKVSWTEIGASFREGISS